MLHELVKVWFGWVENWGYFGIFLLMAMESSVVPVPSEVVMPPAAFWAAQGRMSMVGVILVGTLGSYFGSVVSYGVSRLLGKPLVLRYGSWVRITPEKFELAEQWVKSYGAMGIFTARLLPVIRHLISIPAGVLEMGFWSFTWATLVGAGLWCSVLAWFGQQVIGPRPELLQSPEAMVAVLREKSHWFVGGVILLAALYVGVVWWKRRLNNNNNKAPLAESAISS